jgi:hypothetical protein
MRAGYVVAVWMAIVCAGFRSLAQESPGNLSDEERERVRKATVEHVKRFVVTGKEDQRYEPVDKPLLASSDLSRGELGALWAFGAEGRPVAALELFKNSAISSAPWTQVLTLTTDQLVTTQFPPAYAWTPQQSQLEMQPLEAASTPAQRSTLRERQIKIIARRFDAHEFWDPNNSRFELRLLESPLHAYKDEAAGIMDGALFAFVHGTNPEVLLLIEAHKSAQGGLQWKYGLVRMGSAEMHVNLDGEEIWQIGRTPGVAGNSRAPYWITSAPGAVD